MICKKCGKEIDNASKFCEYCGTKLKQKKKRSKTKKIILSVLIVIVLIVLTFASRYLLFEIASKGIDKMESSASIDSLTVNDDSVDINITNNFSNTLLVHCTDYNINLNIYTNNEEQRICYYFLTEIDKSGIQFDRTYWNNMNDAEQNSHGDNSFDFEEGKIYKMNIDITVAPFRHMKSEYQGRKIISDIDYYISDKITLLTDTDGYTSYLFRNSIDIESYFLYENGEFIKIN